MLLLAGMAWMLWRAATILSLARENAGSERNVCRNLTICYGVIVVCGSAALLLGLWLIGV
jgi:hypothetical protein